MTTARVSQLSYVGAGASDVGAWRSYATDVLGHELSPDSDEHTLYLRCDERHHRLLVEQSDVDDVTFVGWEVADAAEMEAVAAQVEGQGVDVVAGTAGERDRRAIIDFVTFTCPYTGMRM